MGLSKNGYKYGQEIHVFAIICICDVSTVYASSNMKYDASSKGFTYYNLLSKIYIYSHD